MVTRFDREMADLQMQWRLAHIAYDDQGQQNGVRREWLLPEARWQDGLWPGIQADGPDSLGCYLRSSGVQPHGGVHNLKSSWMLGANLYFPFRRHLHLLASFLAENILSLVESVERIELEYAEPPPLDPQTLLGEPAGGRRGSNQTSPDIAFLVGLQDGRRGLILVENKWTEHSFYPCSGRDPQYGNPDAARCLDIAALLADLPGRCYQLSWANIGRPNRRYWDNLNISERGARQLKCCPAATGGYQLFRQQALAEGIAQSGRYDCVVSCVAYDERNLHLIRCMRSSGVEDFRTDWAGLFDGAARFASFSHQQWVAWVRQHHDGFLADWLTYVGERYGIGGV